MRLDKTCLMHEFGGCRENKNVLRFDCRVCGEKSILFLELYKHRARACVPSFDGEKVYKYLRNQAKKCQDAYNKTIKKGEKSYPLGYIKEQMDIMFEKKK